MNLIYCFCPADIPFVAATWLSLQKSNAVASIVFANEKLYDLLTHSIFESSAFKPPSSPYFFNTYHLHTNHCESVYLFTLGTLEICNLVLFYIRCSIPVYYRDCYIKHSNYPLRLVSPLHILLSRYPRIYCTRTLLIRQILYQIFRDPFRTSLFFAADSHCWLSLRYFNKLIPLSMAPLPFSKYFHVPPNSLVFTLSSTENNILINWQFFQSLPYQLYFKPHPYASSDYHNYPSYVLPLDGPPDINSYLFSTTSFLLGFFSFALTSTHRSISLAQIYYAALPKYLEVAYLSSVTFKPLNYKELAAILTQSLS